MSRIAISWQPTVPASVPKPRLVQVKASTATGGKRERWQVALSARERGEFVEAKGTHLSLFASLKRLPEYKPYDLADADAWLREVLNKPKRERREDTSTVTSSVR